MNEDRRSRRIWHNASMRLTHKFSLFQVIISTHWAIVVIHEPLQNTVCVVCMTARFILGPCNVITSRIIFAAYGALIYRVR